MRILFTGGGTGGHVYPIVAIVRALKAKVPPAGEKLEFFFAGPANFPLDDLKQEGVKVVTVPAGKARRYFSLLNFLSPFLLVIGFLKALFALWQIMPDLVFSKGGFGSTPVCLAGWLYRIPLFIHESDAVPGRANLFASALAARIAVGFPEAASYFKPEKTAVIGNPVRTLVASGTREAARTKFGLSLKKPVLVILGGSQGAKVINALIAQSLALLLNDYEIIHQCGGGNFEAYKRELKEVFRVSVPGAAGYHLTPLLPEEDLGHALAAAALVISRGGGGSVFDIALSGKASIIIPLKDSASDHQERNAYDYARAGAAIVLDEDNLTPNLLINEIKRISNDDNLRIKMEKAALGFAKPKAGEMIADEIINLALVHFPQLKTAKANG